MTIYHLEDKDDFIVKGFGIELKSAYNDASGLAKEKSDFWQNIKQDGRLNWLKAIASNDRLFFVNHAHHNKMMYSVGVLSDALAPTDGITIQFPKSNYVVVRGEARTAEALNQLLTSLVFGEIQQKLNSLTYKNTPNTIVLERQVGLVQGEMWVPVEPKE